MRSCGRHAQGAIIALHPSATVFATMGRLLEAERGEMRAQSRIFLAAAVATSAVFAVPVGSPSTVFRNALHYVDMTERSLARPHGFIAEEMREAVDRLGSSAALGSLTRISAPVLDAPQEFIGAVSSVTLKVDASCSTQDIERLPVTKRAEPLAPDAAAERSLLVWAKNSISRMPATADLDVVALDGDFRSGRDGRNLPLHVVTRNAPKSGCLRQTKGAISASSASLLGIAGGKKKTMPRLDHRRPLPDGLPASNT